MQPIQVQEKSVCVEAEEPAGRRFLADLGDTGEVLRYLVGFWAFLLSPRYRNSTLRAWRDSDRNQRIWMLLEGVVATLVGVGIPALIAWLLLGL